MDRKGKIINQLQALNPHVLNVLDESAKHAGHAGNPDSAGQTHYHIQISSDELTGLTRVAQHRMINKLLKEEFDRGLHALSIEVI